MKVFIFKQDYESFVVSPEPSNKEDFIEVEVASLDIFNTHRFDGEKFVSKIRTDFQKDLNQVKFEQLLLVNQMAEGFISKIAELDKTPEFEVKTWYKQSEESKAWMNDKSAPTPTLDAIATGRGIERTTLIIKAYYKAIAFEQIVAFVTGQRQKYESQIKLAKNIEEVKAVIPQYQLPRGLII